MRPHVWHGRNGPVDHGVATAEARRKERGILVLRGENRPPPREVYEIPGCGQRDQRPASRESGVDDGEEISIIVSVLHAGDAGVLYAPQLFWVVNGIGRECGIIRNPPVAEAVPAAGQG